MTSAKKPAAKKAAKAKAPKVITTYKGFDAKLKCRDFQYEVGKTYTHDGEVKACSVGFHACEYPLDVFGYYAPAGSRFAIVEQGGKLSRHNEDSNVASSTIKVSAEISLPGLIKAAIEYTFSRAKPENTEHATGVQGAASSTGYRGAAMASGYEGKVLGADGNALFLVERNASYEIVAVWCGIAGRDGIKADTWYTLKGGKPVEVKV